MKDKNTREYELAKNCGGNCSAYCYGCTPGTVRKVKKIAKKFNF